MTTSETAVMLSDVDRFRVTEAMSEGMRVILTYRGEPYSPAYVCGISGAAFRMAGICPCAPTCSNIMHPVELARLFGYEVEWWSYLGGESKAEYTEKQILARIKAEIAQGRPVLMWHAFTQAEWDVVCGFDESKNELYGRGSYLGLDKNQVAAAKETRALSGLNEFPAFGAVFVGRKIGKLDAFKAEMNALQEAVRHARTEKSEFDPDGKWVFLEGIQCYQRWAREFRLDPKRGRTAGDSYCISIYRSTRRAAADFMNELALKYDRAAEELRCAGHAFEYEADLLDQCAPFLAWDTPEGPDPVRNARLAELLEKAGEEYAIGISEIEKSLKRL